MVLFTKDFASEAWKAINKNHVLVNEERKNYPHVQLSKITVIKIVARLYMIL
jgi:hypothetical protein